MLESLSVADGTSPDFSLAEVPAGLGDACLGDDAEVCDGAVPLEPDETAVFVVEYAPAEEGAAGGRVLVGTSIDEEPAEVNLFGRGALTLPPSCLAEARVAGEDDWGVHDQEADRLVSAPQEIVELRATGSEDPDGEVVAHRWTVVERPEGSVSELDPGAEAAETSLLLDQAGLYRLSLEVTDDGGETSACEVWVEAAAVRDIRITVVWDTPADPDQSDTGFGAGSDVDVHLLHPLGDWFCSPRDCYYANPNPDWGVPFDPSDDPVLDIDDTDGAGPEVMLLHHPEDNRVYRVGVHYFNDHGYGPSFVTVDIYVRGIRRFQLANKRMAGTDAFWDLATIAWPSGVITPIDMLHVAPPNEGCD